MKTLGIFAPASTYAPTGDEKIDAIDHYELAIEYLRKLGYKVKVANNLYARDDAGIGTAGERQDRVQEFNALYFDDEVDALIAIRGGYGCMQLLDDLDYDKIAANPKPIFGYSDLTALFSALAAKSNLRSFHSPVLSEVYKWDDATKNNFEASLKLVLKSDWQKLSSYDLLAKPLIDQVKVSASVLQAGTKILGGNLSLVTALIGSDYLPDFKGQILLLEDCHEPGYKVDRMFWTLIHAGVFECIEELWLGKALACQYPEDLIDAIAKEYGFRVVRDLDIGHAGTNFVCPIA